VPKIAAHALLASAFFFSLRRFALSETIETNINWAVVGGGGAGLLAWLQHRGGG
jgi:hypothetical protein